MRRKTINGIIKTYTSGIPATQTQHGGDRRSKLSQEKKLSYAHGWMKSRNNRGRYFRKGRDDGGIVDRENYRGKVLEKVPLFDQKYVSSQKLYVRNFYELFEEVDHEIMYFLDETGFNGEVPFVTVDSTTSRNIYACTIMNKSHREFFKTQDHLLNGQLLVDTSWRPLNNSYNVRFHKTYRVQTMLQENGHRVIYFPPYLPFFNPIENLFSKRKNVVKTASPISAIDLFNLIESGSIEITSFDCDSYHRNMLKYNRRGYSGKGINELKMIFLMINIDENLSCKNVTNFIGKMMD
ncbi:hypothetical protein RF11_01159 [Thelohanellus kitauei]|uniref:Tc1-like transposase DDE domain-containing protein n=1 Tax=Thelohanellus kitauei TaxID=669202 RepID=A0A0C2JWG2_THEKT|nr:hypothetical protein RF11_01159 [Thelohanellus kitauei]